MFIKFLKKIISLSLINLLIINNVFASDFIIRNYSDDYFSNSGPGYISEIAVAGDSYAQHFYNDEKDREIKLHGYFNEGFTLEMNRETLKRAFTSIHKIIFLSIGVNDRHKSTHPSVFENELRELFDIAKTTHKLVFIHSYMYYDMAREPIYPFTPSEYDAMIRNLILEYDNVYYVDMSDCIGAEYMLPDEIHFNKKFNDIMYDRLNLTIAIVRKMFYE